MMKMKLKDIPFGIISKIQTRGSFTWLSVDQALSMDTDYYYGRSFDKTLSPLVTNLIKLNTLNGDIDFDKVYNKLADIIIFKYGSNWNKLESAIYSDYNPIENYNSLEIRTPDLTRQTDSQVNTDTSNDVDQSVNTFGFNSVSPVPKEETHTQNHITGSSENNYSNTTESETGSETIVKSGNIGVTTSQQMIESEIELRKKNFIDIIYKDIDNIMCLSIY